MKSSIGFCWSYSLTVPDAYLVTLSNNYDRAFLRKYSNKRLKLFLQKSSVVDVRMGSKYTSESSSKHTMTDYFNRRNSGSHNIKVWASKGRFD